MIRHLFFLISTLIFFSCNSSPKKNKVETLTKDSITSAKFSEVKFLKEFSNEFIINNHLDQWVEFISFKESIESISNMDPKGITFYLDELGKKTEELLESSKPKSFDAAPIISRIKVIQMQVMKCKFYSENQESEKLEKALKNLNQYYNFLLSRMISFTEEVEAIPEEKENQE